MLATIFSAGAASSTSPSMRSVSTQMSASLSARRRFSSSRGIAPPPSYRSTCASGWSREMTDEGILRVRRTRGTGRRLMAVRLTVAAVRALHARFDQARTVALGHHRVAIVARVRREGERVRHGRDAIVTSKMPRDRLADERAERVLVHARPSAFDALLLLCTAGAPSS